LERLAKTTEVTVFPNEPTKSFFSIGLVNYAQDFRHAEFRSCSARLRFHQRLLVLAALLLRVSATSAKQADPARYLNDIKSRAAPEMEGRGAGTKGLARAEHLIEKRYKELGLQPAGTHGYLQSLTHRVRALPPISALVCSKQTQSLWYGLVVTGGDTEATGPEISQKTTVNSNSRRNSK